MWSCEWQRIDLNPFNATLYVKGLVTIILIMTTVEVFFKETFLSRASSCVCQQNDSFIHGCASGWVLDVTQPMGFKSTHFYQPHDCVCVSVGEFVIHTCTKWILFQTQSSQKQWRILSEQQLIDVFSTGGLSPCSEGYFCNLTSAGQSAFPPRRAAHLRWFGFFGEHLWVPVVAPESQPTLSAPPEAVPPASGPAGHSWACRPHSDGASPPDPSLGGKRMKRTESSAFQWRRTQRA